MAKNYKITQLPELKNLTGNEELVAVSGGINVKIKTVRTSEFLTATQAISKTSLGLDNVNNTSDANKPINVVAQAALDTLPDITHTHPVSDIVGLQTLINAKVTSADLAGKADAIHSHPISDVTGLQTELDAKEADAVLQAKALVVHSHVIADIPGLQTSLDSKAVEADFLDKADLLHNHIIDDITGLQLALDSKSTVADLAAKADITHNHAINDVSDLQTALNSKSDGTHTHVLTDVPTANAALISIQDRLNVIDGRPHTEGLVSIYLGDAPTYLITNFDSFKVYTLSTTNGTVTLTDDILTYTPATAGPGGFTVNGKIFSITVNPGAIVTPSITNPADNTIDLNASVTLTGSAYQILPVGGESHLNTDWELAADTGFTTIVFSTYNDAANKTSWTVSNLFSNMTYYARVRYRSASVVSDWSPAISFSTKVTFLPANESAILTANDKATTDLFGYAVDISNNGTRVVIGAYQADPSALNDAGKAYIFGLSETIWAQEAILTAADQTAVSNFGMSVAITELGDRVIMGANLANPDSVNDAGAAYIFSRSGTTWTQEAMISANDKVGVDWFGLSVSIDAAGSRVIVGAYLADPGGLHAAGKAYIFSRAGTVWTQEAILTASDKVTLDRFAYSVDMDGTGDRVVIGAYSADPGSLTDAGKAYVFVRSGTTWTEEAILTASDQAADDQFGISVSIDGTGTRIAVGSYLANPDTLSNAGKVYIFTRNVATWTEEAILTASDKAIGDIFGTSVSFSAAGDRIIIGAKSGDPGGILTAGKAYLFSRTNTTWAQEAMLSASDKATGDQFGISVAMAGLGSSVAVGAHLADPGGVADAGKVYIFS